MDRITKAALVAAVTAQSQFAGDSLQLYWCEGNDPLQQFQLQADMTVRTTSGLCVTNVQNSTVDLQVCSGSSNQRWTYEGNTISQTGYCWNLQSQQSYMYPNASVKLWSCQPPNWNDYFTAGYPFSAAVLANFTSEGNSTFTNLCVQSLHVVPPLPTADVLAWQTSPVACFVHFQMATAAGTQGCSGGAPPPITTWAPTALDTDAWVDTCKAMGGSRMVYTAKHGCGFLAWRSNVTGYNYTVANSNYPQVDVVARVVDSARRAGLGIGFYYSVVSNAYCNVQGGVVQPGPINPSLQLNVTQEQYDLLVIAHLTELYGAYGPLAEVWFDGGYQQELKPALQGLFSELQPHVVAFQAEGLMPSPVRWVGSESGLAPYPCWSAADYGSNGAGDPNAATWFPAETDFTLQNGDNWFYNPSAGVHSPSELRTMWETSVGSNTALIIDIAPYPNGTVPPEQVQAAKLLGQYTSACYGGPSTVATAGPINGTSLTATPASPSPVDRVAITEDQTYGQRVREYTVTARLVNGTTVQLGSGSSIGARRIHVLPSAVTVASVTVTVTTSVGQPSLANLSLLHCEGEVDRWEREWEQWTKDTGYTQPPSAPAGLDEESATQAAAYLAKRPWATRHPQQSP